MFKFLSSFACILFALLFITSGVFAKEGPWIMEWYALDPVQGTGTHANGNATDWLEQIFGRPEAEFSELKGIPSPTEKGKYKIKGEDGSTNYSNGTYTVKAGGADIWGSADAFRFTYKEMKGDFEIELKAKSLAKTNDWAKIGPMVRQDDSPNSKYVFMLARAAEGNKYFQERMSKGGSATGNGGKLEDAGGFPVWLKITRNGDDFTAAVSKDGNTWTNIGTTTLVMNDPVLVGLAVTSHSSNNITTGVVSNLTIDGKEPKFADMTSKDIGTIKSETTELGWAVRNLGDVNNSHNLSQGIYESKYGADMNNFVFYGIVEVDSPKSQDVVLNVAQDDEAKIWINGEKVGESNSWTGGPTNTNPYNVHLDRGANIMMIKVAEEGGGDYLNARFDTDNLDFTTKFSGYSVSPKDKLSTTWGNIKIIH